ncbi:PEP carboxykinase-like protein [Dendrothele bispora CBS 962.96]|uniref:PEP carboxykinase-like protein n=1 Tax=Dendrothele bispora (strain CBS 962.96) TaxID=1314807 RepID=A0A4S8L5R7_DENBC|nr:PEP carboxykinase-like protein [Dendrothele bispora CBS 962.96]
MLISVSDAVVAFVLSPITLIWGLIAPLFPSKKPATRTILHKSSGVLKPGEMCLVLGCPGAGCSTFLKTIANNREDYAFIGGDVLYAGMSAAEMAKYYKGEVVYNEEDDRHIATLTVAQTLQFALSTKTPGPNGRLPGVSRKEFDRQVLETILKILNISHTKQTLVGDEFVRGVSGGERKRVSIAEMMATRARVQAWDNSTRGLDASTALGFVKSLRIMIDVLGQTTFVTLSFAPGHSENNVPATPLDLENVFRQSKYARDLEEERGKYKRLQETDKADQEAFRQVRALVVRQFQQKMQDKFQLYTSFGLSTTLAPVLGGAFWNLPLTAAGAFTRAGVIFVALLVTCLDAFGEMPLQMLGRPILRKQAIAIANTVSDIPISFTRF